MNGLKESMQFIAEVAAAYTNTLDVVVRRSFATEVQKHLQTIAVATQEKPAKEEKKKK